MVKSFSLRNENTCITETSEVSSAKAPDTRGFFLHSFSAVLHSEEKNLILTLIELARLGADRGLPMPKLVRLEREIEREQRAWEAKEETHVDCTDGLVEKVVRERRGTSKSPTALHKKVSVLRG